MFVVSSVLLQSNHFVDLQDVRCSVRTARNARVGHDELHIGIITSSCSTSAVAGINSNWCGRLVRVSEATTLVAEVAAAIVHVLLLLLLIVVIVPLAAAAATSRIVAAAIVIRPVAAAVVTKVVDKTTVIL